jgi:fucose permease
MTWLIADDASQWRWGFGLLAGIQFIVTIAFWRTRRRWGAPGEDQRPAHERPTGVLALLAAFLLVAGIEGGAGAWSFTFLTEARSMSDGSAGLLVTGFFGSFTLGRVAMGVAGERVTPTAYLAAGKATTLVGIALFWWNPTSWIAGLGLALAGFGIAPIFPILMVMTPAIVGAEHAHDVVGYELGAAILGAAVVPALMGITVDSIGMHTIPVVLLIVAGLQAAITPGRARDR